MAIPTPYAGSYYPLYNKGNNQYIVPNKLMPFKQISAVFAAFAHAYPTSFEGDQVTSSALALEAGQPWEPVRLAGLVTTAKAVNSKILVFITLGWGKNDWNFIAADYQNFKRSPENTFQFAQSIVDFIRVYQLDGFDIDDENLPGLSGSIDQDSFDGVIYEIRKALDSAGLQDKKTYYLSITPSINGGNGSDNIAMINNDNIVHFDLINTQNYDSYGTSYNDFSGFTNAKSSMFAYGINSELGPNEASNLTNDDYKGLAGIFNWTLSADSNYDYSNTKVIAADVGYPPSKK